MPNPVPRLALVHYFTGVSDLSRSVREMKAAGIKFMPQAVFMQLFVDL